MTALITLVTSLPHFDCHCPSGQVKRFCLRLTSRTCCCEGSCCSSEQARRVSPIPSASFSRDDDSPCCCNKAEGSEDKAGTDNHTIGCAGCTKTLAKQPLLMAGEVPTANEKTPVAEPLPLRHLFAGLLTVFVLQGTAFQPGTSPPPPDLVILLCHFLI